MAQQTITFNANALVKNLDLFAEVQLPYIASVALNRSLTPVVQGLRGEMQDRFHDPVPFTLNSIRTKASNKQNLTAEVYISYDGQKGNAPEDYLKPQIQGGQVFETRFQRRLVRNGFMQVGNYMQPLNNSPAANLGPNGRIRASQYVQALYGIQAMSDVIARTQFMGIYGTKGKPRYRTAGTYMLVPTGVEKSWHAHAGNKFNRPADGVYFHPRLPGIYKAVKGGGYIRVFATLPTVPTVAAKFQFPQLTKDYAQQEFPAAFSQVFKEVVGRENV
jgi:hypothetical protein